MAGRGVNKVILIGNLGDDPEVRDANGTPVCNISIGCSESYKKKDGTVVDSTEWMRVTLWRGLAELAGKHLHKGDCVYIEGRFTTKKWDKDGVPQYRTEVEARELTMLGSPKGRSDNAGDQAQAGGNTDPTGESFEDEDDYPDL